MDEILKSLEESGSLDDMMGSLEESGSMDDLLDGARQHRHEHRLRRIV
jgi:hypothetical protein